MLKTTCRGRKWLSSYDQDDYQSSSIATSGARPGESTFGAMAALLLGVGRNCGLRWTHCYNPAYDSLSS